MTININNFANLSKLGMVMDSVVGNTVPRVRMEKFQITKEMLENITCKPIPGTTECEINDGYNGMLLPCIMSDLGLSGKVVKFHRDLNGRAEFFIEVKTPFGGRYFRAFDWSKQTFYRSHKIPALENVELG